MSWEKEVPTLPEVLGSGLAMILGFGLIWVATFICAASIFSAGLMAWRLVSWVCG